MDIAIKRAYAEPDVDDGSRFLVDRIWPRGIAKEDARLDGWLRDIAPTDELRRWFNHDPERWEEFRRRYLEELKAHHETLCTLVEQAREHRVTLVYGARDEKHNQAVVIQHYLKRLAQDPQA